MLLVRKYASYKILRISSTKATGDFAKGSLGLINLTKLVASGGTFNHRKMWIGDSLRSALRFALGISNQPPPPGGFAKAQAKGCD
jgi:hypothetical protein